MEESVDLRRDGKVAIVTLNVPDKRNAITREVREKILPMIDGLNTDPSCRAIILTGAGDCFCAGGDVSNMGVHRTTLQSRHQISLQQQLVRKLIGSPKPIVAAVEGPAFGAGFAIATACDFVVAGDSATFCAAYGRIGLMADLGLLWSLPQRLTMGQVRRVVMFCEVIKADEARALGIVDYPAPTGGALAVALERAQKLANGATAAIGLTKALLARAPLDLETVLSAEMDAQPLLGTTSDHAEGRLAFTERRSAAFIGE